MKTLMMQCTVEYLNKSNPNALKKLEQGPKFEVGGTEESGFYYKWDLEDNTKYRKLLDGRNIEELDKPLDLSVITKCPEKWILQDVETGQIFQGTQNTEVGKQWKEITVINNKPTK
jgi:hypothetical protein